MANSRIARFVTEVAPPQIVSVMRNRTSKILDTIMKTRGKSVWMILARSLLRVHPQCHPLLPLHIKRYQVVLQRSFKELLQYLVTKSKVPSLLKILVTSHYVLTNMSMLVLLVRGTWLKFWLRQDRECREQYRKILCRSFKVATLIC